MEISKGWLSFLLHLENLNRSKHTIKQYRIDGKQFSFYVNTRYESFDITTNYQLFEEVCKQYVQHIQGNFHINSCNRKIASLKSFIKFAHFREWIPVDFSEKLLSLEKQPKDLDFITESEVEKLYSHYEKELTFLPEEPYHLSVYRNYLLARFLGDFALKPHELITLTWNHIHENILFISRDRQFVISKRTMEVLRMYRDVVKELFGKEHIKPLWIGLKSPHQNITERTMERICQEYSEILKKKVTATSFRYGKIKALNYEEMDSLKKSQFLGYAQTSVFWERVRKIKSP